MVVRSRFLAITAVCVGVQSFQVRWGPMRATPSPARAATIPTTAPYTPWMPIGLPYDDHHLEMLRLVPHMAWASFKYSMGGQPGSVMRAFHSLTMTYGWCYTQADTGAIEGLWRELETELSYISDAAKLARIEVALHVAYHSHLGQKRKSGEPFVHHPVAVAKILAQLRMDVDSIVAGLLHDTVEDTYLSINDVESVFGPVVRRLVEGETKVSKLPRQASLTGEGQGPVRDKQAENLCHLILAMSEDWRVLVVKLSDRLHNMRTLGSMPVAKQERTARETLDVFVPLAAKMGLWDLKTELEDIAHRILHREEHLALEMLIESRLNLLSSLRTNRFGGSRLSMRQALTDRLPRDLRQLEGIRGKVDDIDVRVMGKHIYEAWRQSPELREARGQKDLVVLRVVVSPVGRSGTMPTSMEEAETDRELCYRVLDALHATMPQSDPTSFRDFVKIPKDNGYQALHSVVELQGFPYPIEVHVCTDWMDEVARHGLLAAWVRADSIGSSLSTSSSRSVQKTDVVPLELPWLQAINTYTQTVMGTEPTVSAQSLIQSLKEQLKVQRLVLTREGEILNLDASHGECTALDAAVARMARGDMGRDRLEDVLVASVNGRPVPLSRPLRHGDVVDFVTRPYRRAGRAAVAEEVRVAAKRKNVLDVLYPWCLIGGNEVEQVRRRAVDKIWGYQLRRTARGTVKTVEDRHPAFEPGEKVWLKEAEKRHGRLALGLLAWWWLSSVVPEPLVSSVGAVESVESALRLIAGPWIPSLPALSMDQALLFMALVGFGEVVGSIVPGTVRMIQRPADAVEEHTSPCSPGGERGVRVGSSSILGVQVVSSFLAVLRAQEVSIGRVGMVAALAVLFQSLLGSTL